MSKARCNYHHGDLRNALIIAAAELIERDGTLDFSMAEAASRAGVSTAAPYRHFADKEELLRGVRDLAFLGLDQAAITAMDAHEEGSLEGMMALGHTYLAFARSKRAFFSLMWEDRGDSAERRLEAQSKYGGFAVLVNMVQKFFEKRGRGDVDALYFATQIWSMAHGIATLEANQILDLFDASIQPEDLLDDGARTMLTGILSLTGDAALEQADIKKPA
ncbi:MAG: TetR/AcrR family transcriptional regulator [Luminiphilus sp.]|jgi:AcrR family transcriptional regulator